MSKQHQFINVKPKSKSMGWNYDAQKVIIFILMLKRSTTSKFNIETTMILGWH